jgi:hypothetical protein
MSCLFHPALWDFLPIRSFKLPGSKPNLVAGGPIVQIQSPATYNFGRGG